MEVFSDAQQLIGIWIAAALSLVIFSFLYKDNPVYKIGEHLFLGVSLGYGVSLFYWNSIFANAFKPLLYPEPGELPKYWVLVPMVLGLFILLRLVPRLSWLSRYSFAVYIGGFAGVAVPTVLAGGFMPQLVSTMDPLYDATAANPTLLAWSIFLRVLFLIGAFATLVYFFYSIEHRGTAGAISRVGVLFLMISFGAGFGNTVMARVSLLIGRFQFLLYDWFYGVILGRGS